jgi:hypothetical protein
MQMTVLYSGTFCKHSKHLIKFKLGYDIVAASQALRLELGSDLDHLCFLRD